MVIRIRYGLTPPQRWQHHDQTINSNLADNLVWMFCSPMSSIWDSKTQKTQYANHTANGDNNCHHRWCQPSPRSQQIIHDFYLSSDCVNRSSKTVTWQLELEMEQMWHTNPFLIFVWRAYIERCMTWACEPCGVCSRPFCDAFTDNSDTICWIYREHGKALEYFDKLLRNLSYANGKFPSLR